jgi:mono/diheme cytochrome c family protein
MPSDRPSRTLGGLLTARLWACCAIGVSLGLSSCGGRAVDGLELEAVGQGGGVSNPGDEPLPLRPVRETCEDNPLLAGCSSADPGRNLPSPPEPEASSDEEPLYLAAARNVLASYCGACHGPALTASQASGGINYINDWDELIQAGLIQECSPGRSRIIEVIRREEMPPPGSGLPIVSNADLQVVVNAIEIDCGNE